MTPAQHASEAKKKKPPRGAGVFPNTKLRELRLRLGLTLRDVEKASGVKNTTVYNAEVGCEVSLTTAFALARFYGKPVEYLWTPFGIDDVLRQPA